MTPAGLGDAPALKRILEQLRADRDLFPPPAAAEGDAAGAAEAAAPRSPGTAAGNAVPRAVALSAAGRLLADIATLPLPEEERGQALERVMARPDAPAPDIARALRAALESSGLFYESHLQAWSAGRRPLEALRLEPQARHGAATLEHAEGAEAKPSAAAEPARALEAAQVARELAGLVREQLATLETRSAVLPLAISPGQPATLAIRPERQEGERDAHAPAASEALAWRATLNLDLPRLGPVELGIRVFEDRVFMTARTARPGVRAVLATGAPELRAALQASALVLERMEVDADGL